jgi:hypothetical protein
LRATAKMASVTLIIEKTMKKKFISDLPTLIFSRYETGTTGIFFTPNILLIHACRYQLGTTCAFLAVYSLDLFIYSAQA